MRLLAIALCLLAAATLAGCDPSIMSSGLLVAPGSLYPMYTSDRDTITDSALLGEWRYDPDPSNAAKYFFRKDDAPGSYVMGIVSADTSTTWRARLVPCGDQTFLDVLLTGTEPGNGLDAALARVSLHLFLRLRKEGGQLHLDYLNPDWYLRQLELKQFPLRLERLGIGMPVITSPPEEIRAFYTKAAADPQAFAEVAALHRPGAAKTP